jgi:hypothetical protein
MDDADPSHTVLRLIVDVDDSIQNYLAIDSAGDPSQCEPGVCAAPFELTIEKVAPQGLGNACGNWWDCADQMACFRFDEDQAQGYCTDLCGTVNCDDASIPMQCRDISDGSRWPDGSEACVATSEIGTQTEYDVCDYNYGCEPFKCIASNAYDLDWGECRRPCDGSCSNANESCLDVTENMFEPPPSGQSQYICVPNSDIATKVQNDPCMYSYECQAGLYCEIDTCESR